MTDHRLKNSSYILLLLVLALFSSCRLHRPADVLSPKEMEKYLYDFHLAQAIISGLPQDEKYKSGALDDWALAKNGITRERLETSLVWYTRYPGEFAKIYKKLNRRIEQEYKESQNFKARAERRSFSVSDGDSISLWYLDSVALLNSSCYMSRLMMEQIGDATFKPGDTIVWNGTATVLCADTLAGTRLYMALTLVYNDSISTADTVVYETSSCPVTLSLTTDTARSLESARFLAQFLENSENDRRGMAVISGIGMIRYHASEETVIPDN